MFKLIYDILDSWRRDIGAAIKDRTFWIGMAKIIIFLGVVYFMVKYSLGYSPGVKFSFSCRTLDNHKAAVMLLSPIIIGMLFIYSLGLYFHSLDQYRRYKAPIKFIRIWIPFILSLIIGGGVAYLMRSWC